MLYVRFDGGCVWPGVHLHAAVRDDLLLVDVFDDRLRRRHDLIELRQAVLGATPLTYVSNGEARMPNRSIPYVLHARKTTTGSVRTAACSGRSMLS